MNELNKKNYYDAALISVKHDKFLKLGVKKIIEEILKERFSY